ncbi:hypothetical protein BD779DRAFT_642772 [Infundibulicybe gibba]|nr:hypothetical protein BD779DRAFT_642772 [Infundibulicybe gibba]
MQTRCFWILLSKSPLPCLRGVCVWMASPNYSNPRCKPRRPMAMLPLLPRTRRIYWSTSTTIPRRLVVLRPAVQYGESLNSKLKTNKNHEIAEKEMAARMTGVRGCGFLSFHGNPPGEGCRRPIQAIRVWLMQCYPLAESFYLDHPTLHSQEPRQTPQI